MDIILIFFFWHPIWTCWYLKDSECAVLSTKLLWNQWDIGTKISVLISHDLKNLLFCLLVQWPVHVQGIMVDPPTHHRGIYSFLHWRNNLWVILKYIPYFLPVLFPIWPTHSFWLFKVKSSKKLMCQFYSFFFCGRSVVSWGASVSSTNKTCRHYISGILLKVVLNIITLTLTIQLLCRSDENDLNSNYHSEEYQQHIPPLPYIKLQKHRKYYDKLT